MTVRPDVAAAARTLRPKPGLAHDGILDHPVVHAYLSLRAFGDLTRDVEALIAEVRTRTSPAARILCAGARRADRVLEAAAALPARAIDVVDPCHERLARLSAAADRCGIGNLTCRTGDPSALGAAAGVYEAVVCLYAVHAIADLEGFWAECRRALKPNGVVLAEEYVGARRFAWSDAQRRAADRALQTIVPPAHRVHHHRVGKELSDELCGGDPHLAQRSDEIVTSCRTAGFEILGFASGGCALLQPVLAGQEHTFDPRNWQHNAVLASLFREEARLMAEGVLGDTFAMFVARTIQSRRAETN